MPGTPVENAFSSVTDGTTTIPADSPRDQLRVTGTGAATVSVSSPAGVPTLTVAVSSSWTDVRAYGAVGDGVADDTTEIQVAINSGHNVTIPSGFQFKITNSLYMNTSGQEIAGGGTVTMDASLGKPCLWLGASDANGTLPGSSAVNMKVQGINFLGTGTSVIGSAGIAYGKATTSKVDSVRSWGFFAGMDIRGTSILNVVVNPDFRYNTHGIYDRCNSTDGVSGPDFQGSRVFGGRIEANTESGVVLGSANVAFIGTGIEGNGQASSAPQILLTPGFQTGKFDLDMMYVETTVGNTASALILVAEGADRRVTLTGGEFYGGGSTPTQYIVETLSASTTQSYTFIGGMYSNFVNFVKGVIPNNSFVHIEGCWTNASKNVTADITLSGGGAVWHLDRALGLVTNQRLAVTKDDAAAGLSSIHSGTGQAALIQSSGVGVGALINSTSTGDPLQVSNSGVNKLRVTSTGDVVLSKVYVGSGSGAASGAGQVFAGQLTASNVTNQGLLLTGNKDADNSGTDVIVNSAKTRTAGYLFSANNVNTTLFAVDYAGSILVGGLSGSRIAAGSGAPVGTTQPIGSLHLRTDGGAGTSLYVKEAAGSATWTPVLTGFSGVTASIGGTALAAGECVKGTVSVTGAVVGMAATVSPSTYPGDGAVWSAYVSAAGVITVVVTATKAMTPTASTYTVRAIR